MYERGYAAARGAMSLCVRPVFLTRRVGPYPELPDGPVIASALRLAAGVGFRQIVVNTWHLGDRMAAAVGSIDIDGVEIGFSHEGSLMGTAGGLALARERGLLGDQGPVLIINGDAVLGLDLRPLLERHLGSRDRITLGLLPHLDPTRWSRIRLDAFGRVRQVLPPGRPEPDEVFFHYPGVMAVSRAALDSLPVTPGQVPDRLWWPAMAEGRFGGVVVPGSWREVGTPEDYRRACVGHRDSSSKIHRSAEVAPTAVVNRSFIGRGAVIKGDGVVDSSVVAEGAVVESGARVFESVLLGPIVAAAGEEVEREYRAHIG